ncbi:MAG: alpha,alpha-trehalose-phosphate synthase (UDP-forming), partial [Planctomycetota bacterium]|jgi:trehalose 6-phosphate synthase
VGVLDALRESGGIWFGWNGEIVSRRPKRPDIQQIHGLTYVTLGLSHDDFEHYYDGFSNRVLWPLLHSRADLMEFAREDFAGYLRVNAYFATKLLPILHSDDLVWVHDYHLIPVGAELRRRGATSRLGFFLHTPFPAFDVLATLPGHVDLLRSLCAYDLVGFQAENDLTAFHDAIVRGAGGNVLPNGQVSAFGRRLQAEVFPIGVDTESIATLAPAALNSRTVTRLKGSIFDRQLIVGVDRLDYSKGLVRRFEAYARFLERYPEHRGRITYLQIAPPTRTSVAEYRDLRRRLGALAGDIVGRFSEPNWTPIRYLNRSFTRRSLVGFFRLSRIGLVTPLRDGMNLVAKEYVAAQDPEDPGVLVLSQFAGAAQELESALLVNPYDRDAVADALTLGMRMPLAERRNRWKAMMAVLRENDVSAWRQAFVRALEKEQQKAA